MERLTFTMMDAFFRYATKNSAMKGRKKMICPRGLSPKYKGEKSGCSPITLRVIMVVVYALKSHTRKGMLETAKGNKVKTMKMTAFLTFFNFAKNAGKMKIG